MKKIKIYLCSENAPCADIYWTTTLVLFAGEDVTEKMVKDAQPSKFATRRTKRQTSSNDVITAQDPIKIDESWIPPVSFTHLQMRMPELQLWRKQEVSYLSQEFKGLFHSFSLDIGVFFLSQKFEAEQNQVSQNFCEDYLYKNYSVGSLCKQFPNVNVAQEIKSCIEDIQVCVRATMPRISQKKHRTVRNRAAFNEA